MSVTAGSDLSPERPQIVVEIRNEQPIDLLDFTASLTGLAREHEHTLRRDRPRLDIGESRLLLVDVRKGSIILNLMTALAPFVSTAEVVNTTVDFVRNIREAVNWLAQPNGRLPDAGSQRLKNLEDTLRVVANDPAGELEIVARYDDGKVLEEFFIRRHEARIASDNAYAQRRELEHKDSGRYEKVLMRLHQSSVADVRLDSRSAEKGIVERVDSRPHALIYVSELAGQRIKSAILDPDGNVYQKAFVVDLDVETVGGRPKAYRILAVHEVIDLDDE